MTEPDSLRTTVRFTGEDADVFEALCRLLGRRPHQLAHELVTRGVQELLQVPDNREAVRVSVDARNAYRAKRAREVKSAAAARAGFRVIRGG